MRRRREKNVFLERETTIFEPKTLQKHTNIPKIRAEGAEKIEISSIWSIKPPPPCFRGSENKGGVYLKIGLGREKFWGLCLFF